MKENETTDSSNSPKPAAPRPDRSRFSSRRPGSSRGGKPRFGAPRPHPGGSSTGNRPPHSGRPPQGGEDAHEHEEHTAKRIPEITPGVVRVIPLGGVEEIGKNMTAFEFGDDIIVVDAGIAFPGDEAPGVDYIIPDTTYLEERKHKIRAMVVTHAHLDHIGSIPYVMEKLGNPPIYTTLLTAVMIKKRQEEFPYLAKLNLNVIERTETLKIGKLVIRFFNTTHTIPDAMGIIIETPYGNVVFTGDIKIDHTDNIPEPAELATFEKLGKENNLLLIAESTNSVRPGFSYSERDVHDNLREIIANVPGRLIFGTFASLFERIVFVMRVAEELGKKIAVEGRSMKTNIEIAKELGLVKMKAGTMISSDDIDNYPDNKVIILATGAQGDEFAALMRISQREHRHVKIKKGDTILLSSSVIPGNEKSVEKLKDNLSRQGARIVHSGIANVHSSGHSYAGELEWIHKMIKPKYFMPCHGSHYMLQVHADIAKGLGMPEKNIIVPDNGMILEVSEEGQKFTALKDKTSARVVMVDGLGTNNVKEVVIRDRQMLAQDGMFVIIAIIDMQTGKVRKSPDIISRGFVYLKESQDLLRNVRLLAKKKIEESSSQMHPINFDYVRNNVREELGKFLFQKTHKRPIILPVLIEV